MPVALTVIPTFLPSKAWIEAEIKSIYGRATPAVLEHYREPDVLPSVFYRFNLHLTDVKESKEYDNSSGIWDNALEVFSGTEPQTPISFCYIRSHGILIYQVSEGVTISLAGFLAGEKLYLRRQGFRLLPGLNYTIQYGSSINPSDRVPLPQKPEQLPQT